jgi:thioredoxin-related protein
LSVKEFLQGYVCVAIDVDRNRDLTQQYGVRAIPAMFMLDSEGKNLGRISKRDPQGFIDNVKELAAGK